MDADITRMAREAGWKDLPTVRLAFAGFDLARFATLVRADERKRIKAEPVQEPVAWMYTGIKQDGTEHGPHLVWRPEYMDSMSASKGAKATPLYAAPPQRKPLTDEEILRVKGQFRGTMNAQFADFARAIERAHGIGGDDE